MKLTILLCDCGTHRKWCPTQFVKGKKSGWQHMLLQILIPVTIVPSLTYANRISHIILIFFTFEDCFLESSISEQKKQTL